MDRSLLNRATQADAAPTPGYLFIEIVRMSYVSPVACFELEDYLIKKLQKDDPVVKLKVLRIIKHLCEKGKSDFRRSIQRKADQIKAHLSYRGPPNALTGDAPSMAVREEADACLKALFNRENAGGSPEISLEATGRIQGFGKDAGGYRMSTSAPAPFNPTYSPASLTDSRNLSPPIGGNRMQGFGNPMFDHTVRPPTKSEAIVRNLTDAAVAASKYLPDAVVKSLGNMGVSLPPSTSGGYPQNPPSSIRGGTGGFADGPPGFYDSAGGASSSGYRGMNDGPPLSLSSTSRMAGMSSYRGREDRLGPPRPFSTTTFPPTQSTNSFPLPTLNRPQVTADPGEYESILVEDICAPGGARIAPPPNTLKEFCRKCHTLDVEVVGTLLLQKLSAQQESTTWQTRLRILSVLEAMLSPSPPIAAEHVRETITNFLVDQGVEELRVVRDKVPQCRFKVNRILHLVGCPDGHIRSSSVVSTQRIIPSSKVEGDVNLLDLDEEETRRKDRDSNTSLLDDSIHHSQVHTQRRRQSSRDMPLLEEEERERRTTDGLPSGTKPIDVLSQAFENLSLTYPHASLLSQSSSQRETESGVVPPAHQHSSDISRGTSITESPLALFQSLDIKEKNKSEDGVLLPRTSETTSTKNQLLELNDDLLGPQSSTIPALSVVQPTTKNLLSTSTQSLRGENVSYSVPYASYPASSQNNMSTNNYFAALYQQNGFSSPNYPFPQNPYSFPSTAKPSPSATSFDFQFGSLAAGPPPRGPLRSTPPQRPPSAFSFVTTPTAGPPTY